MKRVDAILVGDMHLRENRPICRTDDWEQVMKSKLSLIRETAVKYDAPVICAGDVFHTWNASPWLISFALENLPDGMITIAGNHDIPRHNPDLIKWSALHTLSKAGKIHLLNHGCIERANGIDLIPFPFGCTIDVPGCVLRDTTPLFIIHKFIYHSQCQDWEKNVGTSAESLLSQLTKPRDMGGKISTALVGDNHKAFEIQSNGNLLLNPGSIFRMTSDQKDFKPRFYLWNSDNEFEAIYFPVNNKDVTDEHISDKGVDEERVLAFLNRMRDDVEIGLDFKTNMKEYLAKNKTKTGVEEKIWQAMT